MISLQILFACVRVIKGQSMCDTGNTTTTVFPPEHTFLITELCKVFLQARLSLSLSLQVPYWPWVVFWAWQDLAGQTLTRPFHARPRKCHLAGVNDYHSNGRVTCSQQEPRSLHLSASHFPCPLFISLQVNYSSCTTSEARIYCTNTPLPPQKKLHTQFTDIITCNEKINVSAWTAKINSSQMSSVISQGCGSYTGEDGGTSCSDFTRPGKTGSNHDWMRNKWINWFLTHVARRCHILSFTGACWQPRGS